jgi:secondary thiamine-phosphate synthase enzyme
MVAGTPLEISVRTPEREVLVDITERVQAAMDQAYPLFSGLLGVFVPHTTAGVTINEGADPAVVRDIVDHLRRLVPPDAGYRHAEGNSDAHIKASLMGTSVLVPVEQGRLRLGTWQSIYLAEFDGPRNRRVWLITPAGGQGGREA